MAGAKKPMRLNLASGGKHWTKDEIESRLKSEVHPIPDGIAAPAFLTAAQKTDFNRIADQLNKLGVMGETDCDTLARYVVAQSLYVAAVKDLRKLNRDRPKKEDDPEHYYDRLEAYYGMQDGALRRQDKYFKQAQSAANALGLTISSRCKLVAPAMPEEPERQNKFKKFEA